MRKQNHDGVYIEIPDDEKQEAILTFPDEIVVRTGKKNFDTPDEFRAYIESESSELRKEMDNTKREESRTKSALRVLNEIITSIDNLKSKDYEDKDEFVELVSNKANKLQQAKDQYNKLSSHAKMKRREVNDRVSDLERNEE